MRLATAWFPALLAIASLVVRWRYTGVAPYGDEGAFYWVARTLPGDFSMVHDLYAPDGFPGAAAILYRPIPIFWYRPLHFLLLWPGAVVSFTGYRVLHLGLTALLPVVVWAWLRRSHVRPLPAAAAAVATFTLPLLQVWTTFALPDALMAVLVIAACGPMQRAGRCFRAPPSQPHAGSRRWR